MTKNPSLNLKCSYPLVQRPPYAALELQRIQLQILVQTGLLTYEKLILLHKNMQNMKSRPALPPKMDRYKSVFPMKGYDFLSTSITVLNWNQNFLKFRISLCTFFSPCYHKTAAVKVCSTQVRGNLVRKTLSSISKQLS